MLGDSLDRNVIDIHLIAFDEVEQQIERTLEYIKFDLVVLHATLRPLVAAFFRLAFLLDAVLVVFFFLGLEFADLARKFVHDLVDGHIEIGLRVLGMNVRAAECEVHLHDVGLFAVVVVKKNDVRSENRFTVAFKVADFFRHKFMNGAGEGDVSRSDVNLHGLHFAAGSGFIPAKIRVRAEFLDLCDFLFNPSNPFDCDPTSPRVSELVY